MAQQVQSGVQSETQAGFQPATEDASDRQMRIRTLSEKGAEQFNERVKNERYRIFQDWRKTLELVDKMNLGGDKQVQRDLLFQYGEYRIHTRDLMNYLRTTRTEESNNILEEMEREDLAHDKLVNMTLDSAEDNDRKSVRSGSSKSSKSSKRSTSSSVQAAKAKAAAAAAEARMAFLEEENKLKKQQASINIDLEILETKRECTERKAEADAYVENQDPWEEASSQLPSEVESREERTRSYVKPTAAGPEGGPEGVPEGVPRAEAETAPTQFKEMANFLLKKDLIVSRFQKFNDDPATYAVWKGSFKAVIGDINVNEQEEMDLLINHLGKDSAKQALVIRSSNPGNARIALEKLWNRLDERYGAPELVELTLKKKLSNFPILKQNAASNEKLYELSDILTEIESYKADPKYQSLLSYFDTSVGVNSVVGKLPHNIQNKWVDRASRYKLTNDVTFPPFWFFVKFVKEMCKITNDPSFRFENRSQQYGREEPRSPRFENRSQQYGREEPRLPRGYPHPVTAKKTEVQQSGESCPIHQGSAHNLDHCREFRSKTIPERKLFLRENNICYRCCKSTSHIAKDCTSKVKCTFCRSDRHTTVLHVFNRQPREPGESSTTTDQKKQPSDPHGGELRNTPNVKCTEVCGEGFSGRSCAKTVLVNVYPEGSPERCIQVYAILDDQSNCTLAMSDLLDSLGVQGKETQYQLAFCSGLHLSSGRKVHALNVQSTDKSYELQLQTVFECNNIPQDQSEIPTPEVAEHFPHLRRIAENIPPLATDAKISLLIGRDTIEAHQVQEQITGPRGSPFAQRLASDG